MYANVCAARLSRKHAYEQGGWQREVYNASAEAMRHLPILPVLAAMLIAAAPAPQGSLALNGKLDTLPHGRWICEVPGDAAGPAVLPIPDGWFETVNNSSYANPNGHGTYLLTGNQVHFTRGPMLGSRFERTSANTLSLLNASGELSSVRCVRAPIPITLNPSRSKSDTD